MNVFPLAASFSSGASTSGIQVLETVTVLAGQQTFQDEIATIRNSGARVVICSMLDQSTDYPEQQLLFKEAIHQGIMGPDSGFIWLTINLPQFSNVGLPLSMISFVNGTLSTYIPETYEEAEVRNDLINRWNNITTNLVAGDEYYYANSRPNNERTLFSYNYGMCGPVNAVLTVSYALHQIIYVNQVEYTGQTLLDTMKSIDFVGPCGRVQYDDYGDFQYNLGTANYIYQSLNTSYQVTKNPFDIDASTLPSIPMSVNLSNVLLNGQGSLSQWEPDFLCVGGCGYGTCVGANDCQCHRGYQKMNPTDTANQASACAQSYSIYEDSITLNLMPQSMFLLTRGYEVAITQAIAASLYLNSSQVQPVDYGMSNGVLIYEFVLFSDTNLSNYILDADLNQKMQLLTSNFVPLLASSTANINYVEKDYLRSTEPVGIFLLTVLAILAFFWIVTLAIAIKLFRLPFLSTKESDLVSRNMGFSWLLNGILFIAIAMSLIAAYLHLDQPTDLKCNARSWILFLSIFLILAVKVSKLYRLHRIFNNPQLKIVSLPNWRLVTFYILPGTLFIIVLLIVGDLGGPSIKFLETSSTLTRQRSWICHRASPVYFNAISIVLIALYMILSLYGLLLRFQERHVRAMLLDDAHGDVFLFLIVPFTMAPLWYTTQKMNSTWVPRSISVVAIIWMILVVFASLIIQLLYRYIQVVVYGIDLDTRTSKFGTSGTINTTFQGGSTITKIELRSTAELTQSSATAESSWNELPLQQMNLKVAHVGRFLNGQWRISNLKYCTFDKNGVNHFLVFLHRPKDWSGVAFTDATIENVMEINPSTLILRLFTRGFGSYLIQAEDSSSYTTLLTTFRSILQLEKTSVSANSLDLLSP